MRNKLKYILGLFAVLFILSVQPVRAADPPAPSLFSNTLAMTLFILMILLLIIIGVLANILIGTADLKLKKKNKPGYSNTVLPSILLIGLLLAGPALLAQTAPTAEAAKTVGGMPSSTFYVMITVIFLELFVVLALLINIKFMLKKEQEKIAVPVAEEVKKTQLSWWDRFNKLRPVTEEAELDLGHEYDGIRELNNRLPPWWLYGFYGTIIFAGIYLWRFQVSHNGPSSKEEYDRSVVSAELKLKEYLKSKGESVDENTVTLLTNADDIAAGKALFTDPAKCPACHTAEGGGNAVGPNLTDDYWVYGGGVKDIFKTIKYGTNKGMRSWKDDLSAKQIAQLTSYIKSLRGTKPPNPKEPQGELYKEEGAPKVAADTAKVVAAGIK
jgi:cytochrome c oxidase cbb3-type subunit III